MDSLKKTHQLFCWKF